MHDISLIPYEPDLMVLVREYASLCEAFADDAITKPSGSEFPDIALRVWDAAKNIESSPSSWGGSLPGVSLDCAGSVMAVGVQAGLFGHGKLKLSSLLKKDTRVQDMNDTALVLNRRLAAHMLYYVLRYAAQDVMCIPVFNPEHIYPGDIVAPPFVTVVRGQCLPPHLAMFINERRMLSTDPNTGEVKIIDAAAVPITFDRRKITENQEETVLVWRCVSVLYMNGKIEVVRARLLEHAEKMIRETRQKMRTDENAVEGD